MLRSLYNYLFHNRYQNLKKYERVQRIKFEQLVDQLLQNDDEEEEENNKLAKITDDLDFKVHELGWNCTRHEGVVTFLDEKKGIVNDKYEFTKAKAAGFWNDLKIGSKLTFLVFENSIVSIKLIDACWEDDCNANIVIPKRTIKEGFKTDLRTVVGTIDEIQEELVKIDIGRNKEYCPIDLIHWIFAVGDNVRLECVITEEESTWNPSMGIFGEIVEIKKVTPNCVKNEIGRVTATFDEYAIFDESVIIDYSNIVNHQQIKLWDEFEYEAIETSVFRDGRNFNWRVIKLVKRILHKKDREIDTMKKVELNDEHLELRQSTREVSKFTTIFNKSNEKIIVTKCDITNNCGSIELQKPDKKFELRPFNGAYKIYFNICPKQYGTFVEELTVHFGNNTKKCLIKFHVLKATTASRYYNNIEVIPGRKCHVATRFIEIKIPEYLIPDMFRRNFDFKKQTQLIVHDFSVDDGHKFLIEELYEHNYLAKMRYLIYLEEIAMGIHFERYRIDRAHFENKDDYLKLEVEGVHEKRPSITMGDFILASDPFKFKDCNPPHRGEIHRVDQNCIYVKFNSEFHQSHKRKDFRIDFFFSRTSFRRQQFALDQVLSPTGLGLNFLFPKLLNMKKNPQIDVKLSKTGNISLNGSESEFFNKSLNVYQKSAVINVLRGETRPLPYIIYGPPGTGKTRTVVECIKQISSKISWSRIIIATPSNSAANLIVENLIESGLYKGGDFVRFVSYNQIEKDLIPQHLKKYCATIDIGHDKGNGNNFTKSESGKMLNASKSIIVQYKVYISTLSSLGPLMHIKFLRDHFTHVIIDEAGQSVEPESLIPISFLSQNKGQVILAGDPKQLGPVLTSQVSRFCGFEKSFLERLSEHKYYQPIYGQNKTEFDEKFVTKLKKNYRSLPSILHIYSHLFYNDELEAEVDQENSHEADVLKSIDSLLWNRSTANKKCSAFFVNVNGTNMKSYESTSWFNNDEASRIFFFVCKLKRYGIAMNTVGIITPYALQVKNLKRIFKESMPDSDIKVGSVEEFQGQERDIIIISTVRTNKSLLPMDKKFGLGFLQCSKRMNVAISRARSVLIVFGKESLLSQDENWHYYIHYTKKNGTYVTEAAIKSDKNSLEVKD